MIKQKNNKLFKIEEYIDDKTGVEFIVITQTRGLGCYREFQATSGKFDLNLIARIIKHFYKTKGSLEDIINDIKSLAKTNNLPDATFEELENLSSENFYRDDHNWCFNLNYIFKSESV